jgi:N-acetylneuraminic acid mutarotase
MNSLIELKKATPILLVWFALVCFSLSPSAVTGTRLAVSRPEAPTKISQRTLSFAERVAYQRAIEDVYWRHRIWPKENPNPKPSLDAVMSQTQLEKKVTDYLRNSQTLEDYRPITADQLQAETDRMAQHTRQPKVLRELFAVLGNDPFVIVECLARPLLAERLLTQSANEQVKQTSRTHQQVVAVTGDYRLPSISEAGGCTDDTWTATTTADAPRGRSYHTAVWTGSEMIVWGGVGGLNTGGRYNPSTDSWTAISTTNAPTARFSHTAVWTGSEMIVWGGAVPGNGELDTGGKYNPGTDTWTGTGTTDAPTARAYHTAIWAGSEMIVWGGAGENGSSLNTGGRYNPSTDSWTATSTTNVTARAYHTAIWTGSEMIVWGGSTRENTGGRYNPSTDSWTATSTTNAPTDRYFHTTVWTGSEMIVWGGYTRVNTGGRYNFSTDSWTAMSTTNAPAWRYHHTALWTGNEMIVWGGNSFGEGITNTGGRYCATPPLPAQLGNISTRAFVHAGDNVMIGGFIVQGTEPKRVIIRAIGSELTQYGVPNALANPALELHDGEGALIASNDNWRNTIIGGIITSDQVSDIRNSGYAPEDQRESAIVAELPVGSYTAIVRGVNNMTGVALMEVYVLSGNGSILANISTRSFVQSGDDVMIGGFIVQGTEPRRVIIRAIGPELSAPPFNVPNVLANPTLELYDNTGALIASNDNWRITMIGGIITTSQYHDIVNSGHAPTDLRESAIIANLPAGNYTAIVRGVNNTSGVALVEVYDLQ